MADVRLFPLEAKLVLLDKVFLVDSVVDEIPRQVLIQPLRPVDKEIRIDLAVDEGLLPVLFLGVGKRELAPFSPDPVAGIIPCNLEAYMLICKA